MATKALPVIEAQYEALIEGAALLDRSERGKIDARGPEAVAYLQGQVTNDVEALVPGAGCYAAILSPKGKIRADARVLRRALDELWLDTEAVALQAALADLRTYRIGRQVEIEDRSAQRGLLSVVGPRARQVVRAAARAEPGKDEHSSVGAELRGSPALLVATAIGVDVFCDAGVTVDIKSVLETAGATPVDERAAEIARIERGEPRYGLDISEDNLPGEVGIVERAVSFTKGCYVGQEPVARMHYKGHPNRTLRGLRLSAGVTGGEPLTVGDKWVGQITSVCESPTFGLVALAILRREVEDGQTLRAGEVEARVVPLPFRR